jgi:site-specific DNA-methyltransferase (adenine-specific)
MIELNKVYNENCLDTMARMPDNYCDFIFTSPPYDNIRNYQTGIGAEWNFEVFKPIAKELSRVLKENRCMVWVVGDECIDGSESLTSFKQALYFKEECGLKVHDTMIYQKKAFAFPSNNRYHQVFEYMFVLSKGKPSVFNPLTDRKNKYNDRWSKKVVERIKDDKKIKVLPVNYNEYGMRTNIWDYHNDAGSVNPEWNMIKDHPAVMPEKIAEDHILSWSNKEEIVYDPFAGSGTTIKMALLNGRKYIGSEVSKEYCDIIDKRMYPYSNIVF